jgi:hypothetical protein
MTDNNEHVPPRQVEVESTDNRDVNTTWLWIEPNAYVEVDPVDLLLNALENANVPSQYLDKINALIDEAIGAAE